MADYEKQINQLSEQCRQCHERFLTGGIGHDKFQSQKADYIAQTDRLNKQLALLKQTERGKEADKKATAAVKGALSGTAVPRDIVNALIKKVVAFPGKRFETHWKFANFAEGL